jgi:hypothetical protein
VLYWFFRGTRWLICSRHCVTSRKDVGLILQVVIGIFHWFNPACRTMVLGSTQPLTEMSTRRISWGVKVVGTSGWQPYHLHVPIVLKYGSLSLLEPSGLVFFLTDCSYPAAPCYWCNRNSFPQKRETVGFIGPQLLLYKISQVVFPGKTAICATQTMHSYSGFGKLSQQFRAVQLSCLCTMNIYFGIWDSVLNTVTRSGLDSLEF